MSEQVKVRVPGKLMLFGEYCVLWGEECLAFSLDRFMSIEAKLNQSGLVCIESDLWSEALLLSKTQPIPKFAQGHIVIPLIERLQEIYPTSGLAIKIKSGWDVSEGLGSSSALCLGVCLAVASLAKPSLSRLEATYPGELWDCAKIAWENQVEHQGFASGYDIACQLGGGLLGFAFNARQWPSSIKSYEPGHLAEFVRVYAGGQGAPTKGVGSKTLAWIEQNQLKNRFIALMNDAKEAFLHALANGDAELKSTAIAKIAELRKLLLLSPCFPRHIEDALKGCRGFDKEFTYKTSGAGGEDAIILFGSLEQTAEARDKLKSLGWFQLDINFPCHGARVVFQ